MGDNKEFTVGVNVKLEGIEALERKIRELNTNQKIAEQGLKVAGKLDGLGLGGVAPQMKDALEKAGKEYQKALGGLMGNYLKEVNAIKAAMEDQVKKAKELTAERDKQIKGSQEFLRLEKEIAATEQNARAEGQRYSSALEKGSEIFGKTPGGAKPNMSVGQQVQQEFGGAKSMGFAIAAAIVGAVPTLLRQEGVRDIVTTQATGSAISGTTGREINSMMSGNVLREMAYLPEKAKAIQDAQRAQRMGQTADALSPLSTIGGMALGGAGIGGALGAFGGPLAGATALGGGMVGGLAGVGKVGYDMLTDPRYRAAQLSPYSTSMRESYQAYQAQDFAENFTKSLQGQQEMNPLKSVALDYMSKNGGRDLNAQRQMGFSDQGLYGGYYNRMTNAGFMPESGLAMSGSILGAGGSTRAARESMMGLSAQRNMDLTNAGSVLGKISGSAGNTGASEQIFKKLLEASVKAGLDSSEFREEQRKFAETTATILNQAGVTNADDAARTLSGFTRFMGGDTTMKGMEGAKSAYEEYQKGSSETGGRGGAIQFAEVLKDKVLRKGSPMALAGLMEIPDEQLSTDHPRIIAAAHQMGTTPEDLVKRLGQAKYNKSMVEVGVDPDKAKQLGNWMQSMGMDVGGNLTTANLDEMKESNPEGYKLYQKIVGAGAMKSSYENKQKTSAILRGQLGGRFGEGGADVSGQVDQALAGGPVRTQDKAEQVQAIAADAMIKNFDKFKDSLIPATKAVDEFGKQLILLAQAMASAAPEDRARMGISVQNATKDLVIQQAKTQSQAKKPSPGK